MRSPEFRNMHAPSVAAFGCERAHEPFPRSNTRYRPADGLYRERRLQFLTGPIFKPHSLIRLVALDGIVRRRIVCNFYNSAMVAPSMNAWAHHTRKSPSGIGWGARIRTWDGG